jgi:hypothetical protein
MGFDMVNSGTDNVGTQDLMQFTPGLDGHHTPMASDQLGKPQRRFPGPGSKYYCGIAPQQSLTPDFGNGMIHVYGQRLLPSATWRDTDQGIPVPLPGMGSVRQSRF